MELKVNVKGLRPWTSDLMKKIHATKNLKPAFKRAVVFYHAWIVRNFNQQGKMHRNSADYWAPLKPSTKARRRKKGKGAKILQDTGALRRDWDMYSANEYGIIRSKHDYSRTHQDGAIITVGKKNKKKVRIPQRKIFPDITQGQEIIKPAFQEHIFGK